LLPFLNSFSLFFISFVQLLAPRRELTSDERAYVARLVAARTGLEVPVADGRVREVLTETRESARRARATSVIIGFMTAASLALGAAAAWFAAGQGGRHRDQAIAPPLRWTWPPGAIGRVLRRHPKIPNWTSGTETRQLFPTTYGRSKHDFGSGGRQVQTFGQHGRWADRPRVPKVQRVGSQSCGSPIRYS